MYGKYEKHVHGSYPLHTVEIEFEYTSIHKIILLIKRDIYINVDDN